MSAMLKQERHNRILYQLQLHNLVLNRSLAIMLGVSEDTIRRDLVELAEKQKLVKVHGGAVSYSLNQLEDYPVPEPSLAAEYKTIGAKAAGLLHDGMCLLTPGGQPVIELLKTLPLARKATFISGHLPTLLQMTLHPGIEAVSVGSKIAKSSLHTTGLDAVAGIRHIQAEYCFLTLQAIDLKAGITEYDWDTVQVKKAMMEVSGKTVGLIPSAMLNRTLPVRLAPLGQIDLLITELPVSSPVLRPYKKAGIDIL